MTLGWSTCFRLNATSWRGTAARPSPAFFRTAAPPSRGGLGLARRPDAGDGATDGHVLEERREMGPFRAVGMVVQQREGRGELGGRADSEKREQHRRDRRPHDGVETLPKTRESARGGGGLGASHD